MGQPSTTLGAGLALALAMGVASGEPAPSPGPGERAGQWVEATTVARHFPPPAAMPDTPGLGATPARPSTDDELRTRLQMLAALGRAEALELGHSGRALPLTAWRFSRAAGRPAVLLIGQQHGDEPAGAEALLALAPRLADPNDPLAAVLDAVDVVMLPRANPDGAARVQRGNADGHDPNRDHLGPTTAEALALARLAQRLDPIVVVDLHEYPALPSRWTALGLLARHDLLVQGAGAPNLDPGIAEATQRWFVQPLWRQLQELGVGVDWYHLPGSDPSRLRMGGTQAALARNAMGLRHAVSLLLESRGLGLGHAHLGRRVWSQVVAVESVLRGAAAHAAALAGLKLLAQQRMADLACRGAVVLAAEPSHERRRITVLDAVTGAEVEREVAWASALRLAPTLVVPRPCGYWLHASAQPVLDRVRALGLQVQEVEVAQELSPAGGAIGLDGLPAGPWQAAPGDRLVSLAQPLAALAVALLDPRSPEGLVAQGQLLPGQVRPYGAAR